MRYEQEIQIRQFSNPVQLHAPTELKYILSHIAWKIWNHVHDSSSSCTHFFPLQPSTHSEYSMMKDVSMRAFVIN